MVQAPQRTAFSGPALIRLLARLTDVDVPESSQSLSDRLSQWLGWTDAIALSSALSNAPPAVAGGARAFSDAEESECARVRASLADAIVGDSVFAVARRRGSAAQALPQGAPADAPVDYAQLLDPLPANVTFVERGADELDVVHLFTKSRAKLVRYLDDYKNKIKQNGSIWVSWPKKS